LLHLSISLITFSPFLSSFFYIHYIKGTFHILFYITTPGASSKAITSGAVIEQSYRYGKSNEVSPISGWGYYSWRYFRKWRLIPQYMKPDLCASGMPPLQQLLV
jgi:hypothetical protein